MAKTQHILIVEDDTDVLDVLRVSLEECGYRVSTADQGSAAQPILDSRDVDLLVTDEVLLGVRGHQLAEYAKALGVPTLLMSGYNEIKGQLEGRGLDFIGKPFRMAELQAAVARALAKAQRD